MHTTKETPREYEPICVEFPNYFSVSTSIIITKPSVRTNGKASIAIGYGPVTMTKETLSKINFEIESAIAIADILERTYENKNIERGLADIRKLFNMKSPVQQIF
jgi:hypothetical protein